MPDQNKPSSEGGGMKRWFTPAEVKEHCIAEDIWVSFLGKVYDLTPLLDQYRGEPEMIPLVKAAGTDITHWFDKYTGELRTCIDPASMLKVPYTPHGRFVHVPPRRPLSNFATDYELPWWKDPKYCIGILSQRTRKVRIINTLTSQEFIVEVCSEEPISHILRRYKKYNSHAESYTWKYLGKKLNMDSTLTANGIRDDGQDFYELNIDEDQHLPGIHVYYNDDLTVG
eukprot:Nk52_evm84s2118 gene=Nk52_evmTU84s2118